MVVIHICTITAISQIEESRMFIIQEPRNEISKNRTSGEEAWLNSLKEKGNSEETSSFTTSKTKEKSMHGSFNKRTETLSQNDKVLFEETEQETSMSTDSITKEFLQLSQPHGLESTSSVDRLTMAQLLNLVHSDHDKPLESNLSSITTANYFIGLFYFYGLTGMKEADYGKAVEYFQKAAENGHGDAQCSLGLILYYGIQKAEIREDRKSAMIWFYRASIDSDHPRGHWLLGKSIYEGMFYDDIAGIANIHYEQQTTTNTSGIVNDAKTRNFAEAAKLFEKAAKHDVSEAIHQLGVMYEYGLIAVHKEETEKYKNAIENYKRAAELGYVESFYHLGLMYAYGRGTTLNYTIAAEYFRQGAMNNHSPSMRYLAIFAMNGYNQLEGIPNSKLALHWFEKCVQTSQQWADVKRLCITELNEMKTVVENIRSYQSRAMENLTLTV